MTTPTQQPVFCPFNHVDDTPVRTPVCDPGSPYHDSTGRGIMYGDVARVDPAVLIRTGRLTTGDTNPVTAVVTGIRTSPYCDDYYVVTSCNDQALVVRSRHITVVAD